jgi:predicted anti-sigma-YlaC factor YlaD
MARQAPSGPGGQGPVTHERVRAELSARLDGEQSTGLAVPVAEHLAGCAACQQWQQAAEQVTVRVRQAPGPAAPDRTGPLLAAVLADQAPRRRPRRVRREARAGLAAAALAQFVIIVPALLLGNAGGGAPVHASHELGAFELALAAGFALAAVRPALARGMLPLAGVATVTLAVLAFVDSALGYTTLIAETPHLITLVGAVLLFVLVRTGRHGTGRPWPAGPEDPDQQARPGGPGGRAQRGERVGGSQFGKNRPAQGMRPALWLTWRLRRSRSA